MGGLAWQAHYENGPPLRAPSTALSLSSSSRCCAPPPLCLQPWTLPPSLPSFLPSFLACCGCGLGLFRISGRPSTTATTTTAGSQSATHLACSSIGSVGCAGPAAHVGLLQAAEEEELWIIIISWAEEELE